VQPQSLNGSLAAAKPTQGEQQRQDTAAVKQQQQKSSTGTIAKEHAPVAKPAKEEPLPKQTLTAKLLITQDYGRETVLNKTVHFAKGESVLDILKQHAKVKTAYGGAFISSINGIASGFTGQKLGQRAKMDWFYYVNGVTGGLGSDDYYPQNGDVIWWDYHAWGSSQFIPAIIGAYPEPFVNGYQGKTTGVNILATPGGSDAAAAVKAALQQQGVRNLKIVDLTDELLFRRDKPTLVIGTWPELSANLAELNAHAPKRGIFARFSNEGLCLLNAQGDVVEVLTGSAGLIAGTADGMGDTVPLWLVIGTDTEGLQQAITLLRERTALQGYYGVAVRSGKVIALPAR